MSFQGRYAEAQSQGMDMQVWLDTATFAFQLIFQSYYPYDGKSDPKDRGKPDTVAPDTISPKVQAVWAEVLYSKYPIYDILNPTRKLGPPSTPTDLHFGLTSAANLLELTKECFTRVVESGTIQVPIGVRTKFPLRPSGAKSDYGEGPTFDAAGRNNHKALRKGQGFFYTWNP